MPDHCCKTFLSLVFDLPLSVVMRESEELSAILTKCLSFTVLHRKAETGRYGNNKRKRQRQRPGERTADGAGRRRLPLHVVASEIVDIVVSRSRLMTGTVQAVFRLLLI